MKPPPFSYRAPSSIAEVAGLLATHSDDARVIAGGQSLIPLMNLRMIRPEVLIDLNRIEELRRIELQGDILCFGAMVRQSDAQTSPLTLAHCPLIAKAIARAGPIAVRNRGTLGGTLAHADRTAEMPGVAIALDARFVLTRAEGERVVPADEFFQGDMTTVIEPEEFLTAVHFPIAGPGVWTDFLEVGVRREGVALVGLAAQFEPGNGARIAVARLAVTGVDGIPVRLTHVEALISEQDLSDDLLDQATALASESIDPTADIFTRANYRRSVAGSLVRRALTAFRAQKE